MAQAADSKIDPVLGAAAAEQAYAAAAEAIASAPGDAVKPAPAAKQAPTQPKARAKAPATAKVVAKKTVVKAAPNKAAAKKTVKAAPSSAAAGPTPVSQIKDTIMTKTKTAAADFTAKLTEAASEAQDRAKAAFEKGSALFAEAGEFSKGNVEAIVESGKILASGLQDLGKGYVTEGKSAFETMTADAKELAAIKSPADFFKLQGEIMRRNFDAVVATGSKHSEALVKLANESIAPLSTRVSVAIEKVKQAA